MKNTKVDIDVEKIMKQTPKSKKQHLIAINDMNYACLKVASTMQGYTQHGVYLNDILAEFFTQIGIMDEVKDTDSKMIVNS